MRLRKLEAALRQCREHYDAAERQRVEAASRWEQSARQRQDFAETSWRELIDHGQPTGEAMSRHERRLAWLDQVIMQRRTELDTRTRECAEAKATLETAIATWRQARSKLDALGEMKQGWLRDARNQQTLREENNMEELLLSQIATR
jgi:flagellar biosynthesis chaperone FliJ